MAGNAEHHDAYGAEHANFVIDVQGILEALHRSGFTAQITCRGRGPIDVALGHPVRGIVADTGSPDEVLTKAEAALWLRNKACQHFPDSRFAWKYRDRAERPGAIYTPGTSGRSRGAALAQPSNPGQVPTGA